MEISNSENPNEKIDFILSSLIEYSSVTEFNYPLYKSFAEDNSKAFIRFFNKIDSETDRNRIISYIQTDERFTVNDIVTNVLTSNRMSESISDYTIYLSKFVVPDKRIKSYESNYKRLKEIFLNFVLDEIKNLPSTRIDPQDLGSIINNSDLAAISVFKGYGQKFFEESFSIYYDNNKKPANDLIAYYYHKMITDGLIHDNQEDFKNWLYSKYNHDINGKKLRTDHNDKKEQKFINYESNKSKFS